MKGMRQLWLCLITFVAIDIATGVPATAQAPAQEPNVVRGDPDNSVARGKIILEGKCGRCHAVEATGESPLKEAPPMRDIYPRFNPRELQAELSEGMVSKHKEMPQIEFSDEDVHAILAYLYSLVVRK
jgi:mono/diheme cytochrome c family protein